MRTVIIAYIPVLHAGYKKLFESNPEAKELCILGPELISQFPHLTKDIRQLDPDFIKTAVESWKMFEKIAILDEKSLLKLAEEKPTIILPNEDVMKSIVEKYLARIPIKYSPIFFKWDKHNTVLETEINPDRKVSKEKFDREMIEKAGKEGEESSDIWRRIGSVVVKDGKVIIQTHNKGTPTEQTSMYEGDPRNNFHKGCSS